MIATSVFFPKGEIFFEFRNNVLTVQVYFETLVVTESVENEAFSVSWHLLLV